MKAAHDAQEEQDNQENPIDSSEEAPSVSPMLCESADMHETKLTVEIWEVSTCHG